MSRAMPHHAAFFRWAPAESPWSAWAKPALFATAPTNVPEHETPLVRRQLELNHLPDKRDRAALVVELRGEDGVHAALQLAEMGYRPVPLYNVCCGPKPALDVLPLASALVRASGELEAMRIRDDAPPAFLLDADRMRPSTPVAEGRFDNRWIVFPQDFPSATFLRSRGIEHVVVIQDADTPQQDLAHVLLRWQEGGLRLSTARPGATGSVRPLVVTKPRLYRRAWYRMLAVLGLRRSNVGGFGAMVPIASAG